MAITVSHLSTGIQGSAGQTVTATFTSGIINAGELLLAFVQKDGATATTTNDGGWTLLSEVNNDSAAYTEIWYKTAVTADESVTSYTWGTDNEGWVLVIYRVDGADQTPIELEALSSTSDTSTAISPATTANAATSTFFAGAGCDSGAKNPALDATVTDNQVETQSGSGPGDVCFMVGSWEEGDTSIAQLEHSWSSPCEWSAFVIEIKEAATGDHPLDAGSGDIDATGTAVDLTVTRELAAGSGDITVTGTAVDFPKGVGMPAGSGDLTVTGTAVDFPVTRNLAAGNNNLGLSGTDVTLTYAPTPPAGKLYLAAGRIFKDATNKLSLLNGQIMQGTGGEAEAGAYTLPAGSGNIDAVGTAVALAYPRTLDAGTGVLTATGTAIDLSRGFKLAADTLNIGLSGTAITLDRGYVLDAVTQNLGLSGTDADLIADRKLVAGSGDLTATGTAVDLIHGQDRTLTAESGNLTVTGTATDLTVERRLVADKGDLLGKGTYDGPLLNTDPELDTEIEWHQEGSGEWVLDGVITGTGLTSSLNSWFAQYDAEAGQLYDVTIVVDSVTNTDAGKCYLYLGDTLLATLDEPGTYRARGIVSGVYNDDIGIWYEGAGTGTIVVSEFNWHKALDTPDLSRGWTIQTGSGNWTATGTAVDLAVDRVLDAESGTATGTGTDVALTYSPVGAYVLPAGPGDLTVTGTPSVFKYGRGLVAESGHLVGKGADYLGSELNIDADLNTIGDWSGNGVPWYTATGVITGTDVGVLTSFYPKTQDVVEGREYEITIVVDSFDGINFGVWDGISLPIINVNGPGTYIARHTATSNEYFSLVHTTGSLSSVVISEYSFKEVIGAALTVDRHLAADTGQSLFAGYPIYPTIGYALTAESGTLTATGTDAGLANHRLTADQGSFLVIGSPMNPIYSAAPPAEAAAGSWDYKRTKKRYDVFKKTRQEQRDADAAFMRMLLGEELQEGEEIIVEQLHKKVKIRLDVASDIEELAPKIRAAVPFPVLIERIPRKRKPKKKKRVITREIIMQDDADLMKRLFDI